MNHIVLSLGSNDGDRVRNVLCALEWLSSFISKIENSPVYETPDHTGHSGCYVNAVVEGFTSYGSDELNLLLKDYEIKAGRTVEKRAAGLVPIDIDIVVWNGDVVRPRDFSRKFFSIGYQMMQEHQNLLAR